MPAIKQQIAKCGKENAPGGGHFQIAVLVFPEVLVFFKLRLKFIIAERSGNSVYLEDLEFGTTVLSPAGGVVGAVWISVTSNGPELAIALGDKPIGRYTPLYKIVNRRLGPAL